MGWIILFSLLNFFVALAIIPSTPDAYKHFIDSVINPTLIGILTGIITGFASGIAVSRYYKALNNFDDVIDHALSLVRLAEKNISNSSKGNHFQLSDYLTLIELFNQCSYEFNLAKQDKAAEIMKDCGRKLLEAKGMQHQIGHFPFQECKDEKCLHNASSVTREINNNLKNIIPNHLQLAKNPVRRCGDIHSLGINKLFNSY